MTYEQAIQKIKKDICQEKPICRNKNVCTLGGQALDWSEE